MAASADIDLAAKRVVYSKFLNAGQICLAGNHVFIAPSVHDEFVERASFWIGEFMKDDGKGQAVRIVNERNYDRLIGLLNQTGGNIVYGGNKNRDDKYIQPTVVTNVTMQGRTLPVIQLRSARICPLSPQSGVGEYEELIL